MTVCKAVAAQAKDIVDTAVPAGNFKTLAAALGTADLDALLKERAKLEAVCTYQALSCKVMSKDLKATDKRFNPMGPNVEPRMRPQFA